MSVEWPHASRGEAVMAEPAERRWTVEGVPGLGRRHRSALRAGRWPDRGHGAPERSPCRDRRQPDGAHRWPASATVSRARRVRGQAAGSRRQLLPVRSCRYLRRGRSRASLYRRAGDDHRSPRRPRPRSTTGSQTRSLSSAAIPERESFSSPVKNAGCSTGVGKARAGSLTICSAMPICGSPPFPTRSRSGRSTRAAASELAAAPATPP